MKNFYKELPEGYELIKVVDAKTKSFSRFMNIGSLILTIIVCALTMIIKKVKFQFTDDIPYLLMSVAIFFILIFGFEVMILFLYVKCFFKIFFLDNG